ncbi:QCR8 protein, partial [Acromyrmex heyeri]
MGLQFGNLPIRIRRIVYYSLSPLEQRVWAKSVTHGIPNILRRVMRVLPPMIPGAYLNILLIINATYIHTKIKQIL